MKDQPCCLFGEISAAQTQRGLEAKLDEFVDELVNQPPRLLGAFGRASARTHQSPAAIARPASQQVAAGKSTANPKTPYDAMKLEDMEQLGAIKL